MAFKYKLKYLDWFLVVLVILLAMIGAVMVYSSSSYLAANLGDLEYFFKRQLIFDSLGLLLMVFVFAMNIKILRHRKNVRGAYLVSLCLLVVVLIVGEEINGAKAWLDLGFFQVQPAEIAKLSVIWYLARYFSRKQNKINHSLSEVMPKAIVALVLIIIPIAIQPDMGTAIIITSIAFTIFLSSGVDWKLSILAALLTLVSVVGVFILIKNFGEYLPFIQGYQIERFQAFFDPFSVSDAAGLQLVNSYYALSRGGLRGVGLGNSVQKSGYLPEPHTDFIMAILAEELGLILTIIIIAIFFAMVVRIYLIAIRAKDSFHSLMCIGIATMFLVQASINLGGVVGLLPITGVTFPFISYGGSSLLISFIAIGFVLNIQANEKKSRLEFEE